jgi:hypothetical protein
MCRCLARDGLGRECLGPAARPSRRAQRSPLASPAGSGQTVARARPETCTAAPPATPATSSSPFDAGRFTNAPRHTQRPWARPGSRPRPPYNRGWGYGGFYVRDETVVTPPPDSINELSISGSLELAVEPRSADVYVDGFYVGTVDDVTQNGLLLRAGRHWIDLRAEGYETLTVPVGIAAGQAVRYRGELAIVRPQPGGDDVPRGPQTIYVIRGCYAGNRPPTESALPRGCDIANLRTLAPR